MESGKIPLKHLFTIRPGETVRDNVRGGLVRAESDIIKIKGRKGTWCCVFLDFREKACRIYEDRPLECRLLNCRAPEALERRYEQDRLCRKDLLFSIEGLWDLVEDHEQRCSIERLRKQLRSSSGPRAEQARGAVDFMLRYDAHVRRLVVEKGKMDPEIVDFLFGRPLSALVPGLRKTSGL